MAREPIAPLWLAVAGVAMLVLTVWAYWPTLSHTIGQWRIQPDYSHGFLVLPIAVFFLWVRRSTFPSAAISPAYWGGLMLLAAAALRLTAGLFYLVPLDGWTVPLWIAGTVWMLYGWACLRWSLPSIVFLWFMFPLPYSVERWLSVPLQSVATKLSTAALLMLGQPALSEGNTIWMGEHQLNVEEACSGLRIFVGIFALAFAFVLFSRWSWWQKVIVLLAVLPVAVFANVLRIVATGLLYQFISSEVGQQFSHDISGIVMIPVAAGLFWALLVYLDRLFPLVEDVVPTPVGNPSVAR